MSLIRFVFRACIYLVILTLIGQIPVGGKSLENRYHRFVNSPKFQKSFWTAAHPVVWTWDKIEFLVSGARREKSEANAR